MAELPGCDLQPKVQLDSTLVSTSLMDTGANSFSPMTWLMLQIIYSARLQVIQNRVFDRADACAATQSRDFNELQRGGGVSRF